MHLDAYTDLVLSRERWNLFAPYGYKPGDFSQKLRSFSATFSIDGHRSTIDAGSICRRRRRTGKRWSL